MNINNSFPIKGTKIAMAFSGHDREGRYDEGDNRRKLFIILLEGFGAEDSHFLRSAIKSSTESNDLVCTAAISLSASASAFSKLNSLKYGGRDNAYLINSATASSMLGLFAYFIYRSISSNTSSGIFIVNSRFDIFMVLLCQKTIQSVFKSINAKNSLKHAKNSLFIYPYSWNLFEVFIESEDKEKTTDN